MAEWRAEGEARDARVEAGRAHASGRVVAAGAVTDPLEAVLRPGDRVCLEGDNQKQPDCIARGPAACGPEEVHGLHMVQSGIVLPERFDVFGILFDTGGVRLQAADAGETAIAETMRASDARAAGGPAASAGAGSSPGPARGSRSRRAAASPSRGRR